MILSTADIAKHIPALITAVEAVMPENGTGVDKAEAVLQAVVQMVPAEQRESFITTTWPIIKVYADALVALYNLVGLFRK